MHQSNFTKECKATIHLRLVRHSEKGELIQNLEQRYRSRDELQKRLKNDPKNLLYQLDLEKWQQLVAHPDQVVVETETIRMKNLQLLDLKLLQIIKKETPHSILELSTLVGQDTEKQVHHLAREGLIKLVSNQEGVVKPRVDINRIEIDI